MRRLFLILISFISGISNVTAQIAIGEWRAHMAYYNATRCIPLENRIFTLSDGSLYSYNQEDSYVDIYNKATCLSDQGIAFMEACSTEKLLCLVYNNANIDLFTNDEKVYNLPDFVNNTKYDPTINDITINNSDAYLATTFGVVIVNLKKKEFSNTYPIGENIRSCASDGKNILAAAKNGVYVGNLNDNLLDKSNWHQKNQYGFQNIIYYKGQFIALAANNGLYINIDQQYPKRFLQANFKFIHVNENVFYAGTDKELYIFNDNIYKPIIIPINVTFNDAVQYKKTLWTACDKKGLNGYTINQDNTLTQTISNIFPNSPVRNYCDYIYFTDDERLLVAGGCLDYLGTTTYKGTAEIFEDETWSSFQEENIVENTELKYGYNNLTCIVQDPADATHHYVSSYGQGIYEFRNGKYVSNINSSNSSLETAIIGKPYYTRISRLQFDKKGNLWITNSHAVSPIKVLKQDGELIDLYYKELKEQPTVTDILFDSNGLSWVVVMRSDAGIFCIDDGGTPFNTSDDRTRFISPRFTDQDGNSTTIDYIYDIAEDKDGYIWLLTNQGPFIIQNPTEFFNSNFHFTKIKVPRNDGSNYADYLLDAVYTTCIAIDDAGRKWIGTQSNGIYLISADNHQTIHHFTKTNSPLPSNNIKDIAIKQSTGEVFIATGAGLVSYMSDATKGADSFEKSAVFAYPNPVLPDYEGIITIVGLKSSSTVKIINTAGRIVTSGVSLGGSFSWNGKDNTGRRVSTGVYFVLATDEEGQEGICTKIVFVN